jgi:hypothetical protein
VYVYIYTYIYIYIYILIYINTIGAVATIAMNVIANFENNLTNSKL